MPKRLLPGQSYAGHRPDRKLLNVWLPVDAQQLLYEQAGNPKGIGQHITRLIREHQIRLEERQKVSEQFEMVKNKG